MGDLVRRPAHVKFRREAEGGLVYDHENYGYEDASLYAVSDTVIDVLEFVDDGDADGQSVTHSEPGRPREEVEAAFSPGVVASLLDRGVLTRAD